VLDPIAVDPVTVRFTKGLLYYDRGTTLFVVPSDGSAPPAVAQANAARYLVTGPQGQIAYSLDPDNRYISNAGDGWVGDFNFMERGRRVRFSADGGRLYFLEHAATLGTVGDLTSIALPSGGGAPAVLGLNVHSYDLLDDGRLLAIENHVYAGTWNRLVVINEAAHEKRWVVPSATEFFVVPGSHEIIADVVTGASGYDIVRTPSP
jgi:hypothetical protein